MSHGAARQFSLPAAPLLLELVEATHIAQQAWRYTARPGWSSPGESMWMRLSKFSLCNRLSSAELTELFVLRDANGLYMMPDLRRKERWNEAALATILELPPGVFAMSFCVTAPRQVLGRVSTELRYCKQCLEMGFHAAWFQWLSAERCPLHRVFLRSGCFDCSAPIPYAVGACLAVSPLRCPTCTRDWVPSLSRPGGSCDPIDGAAARLMQNWGEYVNDAGSRESYVRRDHQTGQYLVDRSLASDSAATRPHFVTMVNRLFEMPPPSLRQVSGAYKADRESSVSHRSSMHACRAPVPTRPVLRFAFGRTSPATSLCLSVWCTTCVAKCSARRGLVSKGHKRHDCCSVEWSRNQQRWLWTKQLLSAGQ